MRRTAACLAALVLVAGGCGSDSKSKTSAKSTPTTSTETQAPVQGGGGKSETRKPKTELKRTGETVATGNFLFFKTPSGKIGCAVTRDPSTLRCDTKYETSFSRSGHRCAEGDYGHSFEVDQTGAGKAICAGDTVFGAQSERKIPYGKTWLLGPFSCSARESGLTCRNAAGHGFSLSVQSQRLF
jgi:hypothetical protein